MKLLHQDQYGDSDLTLLRFLKMRYLLLKQKADNKTTREIWLAIKFKQVRVIIQEIFPLPVFRITYTIT